MTEQYFVKRPIRQHLRPDSRPNASIMVCMQTPNRTAILALAAAGALWGLTVPLSKLSLEWLGPGWLTVARFAAAAPLLALLARRDLRGALAPRVVAAGAIGFGAVIVLQNAGIERTSVTHAALVVGAAPVLVALIAAGLGRSVSRPVTWGGYALALAGIAFVARAGGGERVRGRRPARARVGRGLGGVHRRPAGAAARARRRQPSPRCSSPRAGCSRSRSPH